MLRKKTIGTKSKKTMLATSLPAAAVRQLGRRPDTVIAKEFGLKPKKVRDVRLAKRIPRSGTYGWTSKSRKLLGTASDVAIANRLRIKPTAVFLERHRLGIPSFHPSREAKRHVWTKRELAMLGKSSDSKIGKQIGLDEKTVREKRQLLGIPSVNGPNSSGRKWTKQELDLLGKFDDIEVGKRIGRNRHAVSVMRRLLGIAKASRTRNVAV